MQPSLTEDPSKFKERAGSLNPDLKDLLDLADKEPCDDPDCDEVVSPCCKEPVVLEFGTLPVKAQCPSCKKSYILRELITVKEIK